MCPWTHLWYGSTLDCEYNIRYVSRVVNAIFQYNHEYDYLSKVMWQCNEIGQKCKVTVEILWTHGIHKLCCYHISGLFTQSLSSTVLLL